MTRWAEIPWTLKICCAMQMTVWYPKWVQVERSFRNYFWSPYAPPSHPLNSRYRKKLPTSNARRCWVLLVVELFYYGPRALLLDMLLSVTLLGWFVRISPLHSLLSPLSWVLDGGRRRRFVRPSVLPPFRLHRRLLVVVLRNPRLITL